MKITVDILNNATNYIVFDNLTKKLCSNIDILKSNINYLDDNIIVKIIKGIFNDIFN